MSYPVSCSGAFTNLDNLTPNLLDLTNALFSADTQWVSVEGDMGSSRVRAGSGLLLLRQDSCRLGGDCRGVQ